MEESQINRAPPPSSLWQVLLSAAVAIFVSGAAYVFSQGALQASVAELTRRISNVEQGMVTKGEMLEAERRIQQLESFGSPALAGLKAEITATGNRITNLEQSIPRSIAEANAVNAQQNLKIAELETRQLDGLRRLLVLETGTVPPLGDRLQVLTTGAAVTVQRIAELNEEITRLTKWKNDHMEDDKIEAVKLGMMEQSIKACHSQ